MRRYIFFSPKNLTKKGCPIVCQKSPPKRKVEMSADRRTSSRKRTRTVDIKPSEEEVCVKWGLSMACSRALCSFCHGPLYGCSRIRPGPQCQGNKRAKDKRRHAMWTCIGILCHTFDACAARRLCFVTSRGDLTRTNHFFSFYNRASRTF